MNEFNGNEMEFIYFLVILGHLQYVKDNVGNGASVNGTGFDFSPLNYAAFHS